MPEVSDLFKRVDSAKQAQYLKTKVSQAGEALGPHTVKMPKGAIPDYIKLSPYQDFCWRIMGRYATEKASNNQQLDESLLKAHSPCSKRT
ncbi:MAG: hypothetical protein MUE55_01595 [Thermoplasmata archaeon]|nr:hypothetical protein [Thermoplasmata archaeon]